MRQVELDHRNQVQYAPAGIRGALMALPPFPGKEIWPNVSQRRRQLEAWIRRLGPLQVVTLTLKGKRRVAHLLASFLRPDQ